MWAGLVALVPPLLHELEPNDVTSSRWKHSYQDMWSQWEEVKLQRPSLFIIIVSKFGVLFIPV